MLYYNTVDPKTLGLLKDLQKLDFLSQTRLVGGTSLALQFGHRESVDIDLFGKIEFELHEIRKNLDKLGKVETISVSNSIKIFTVNGIKLDLVNYPFKWLSDSIKSDDLILADIKDIAAMKLSAITNRGSKKDFVDIYYLLKHFTFVEMLSFYMKKYDEDSQFLVLKSIVYFADAETEPMPKMKENINWIDIKSAIKAEVKQYT